jgi:hypothetical protein
MGEPTAEVRVRLVVDDQSEGTLERVKEGLHEAGGEARVTNDLLRGISLNLEHIAHAQAEASRGGGDIAGEVAKGNVEFALMKAGAELVAEGVKQAWEFTEKLTDASLEAAEAAEAQEKHMAGFLFLMDGGKHSMQELREYTADQREEFAKFGIEAGVSTKSLVDSYDKLIEKGTMSSEKAKDLAEQMAIVGRVVPGGAEALAQGMSGVEMGMVRARNPIVQLIAATHMLQGNAKSVAQQMQHMAPTKQMELAEQAIARQAESLKKMGAQVPDMKQLRASFGDVKEGFLESMGNPMMEALVPQLVKLRDFLAQHMEQIKAFGERVGVAAGEAIEYVSNVLQGIYEGLRFSWDDFKTTFHQIFGDWEAAWAETRTDSAHIKSEFADVGIALTGVFKVIAGIIHEAVDAARSIADVLHLHAPGTSVAGDKQALLERTAKNPLSDDKTFEKNMDAYAKAAMHAGMSFAEAQRVMDQAREERQQIRDVGGAEKQDVLNDDWAKVNEALQYNISNHREGLAEYQVEMIAGSKDAQQALLDGKIKIHEGMDEFIRMLNEKAPELAAKLHDASSTIAKGGGIKPQGGNINFVNSHFHIKQDFQDQDPDRVATVFRKELSRSAMSATVSRLSGGSGF